MTNVDRDQPLFEKLLPVEIIELHCDDRDARLMFRILKGTKPSLIAGQVENIYYYEISDENDPYFLYYFIVSESDYPKFKRENNFIVEFNQFYMKIITWLTDNNLRLKIDLTSSVFNIIEINDFNIITRVKLQFNKGDNEAIKSYLAGRLNLSLLNNQKLSIEHEQLKTNFQFSTQTNNELTSEILKLRTKLEIDTKSLQAVHAEELSNLQRTHFETFEEYKNKHEKIIKDNIQVFEKTKADLQEKISHLEAILTEESLIKNKLDLSLQDCQRNLKNITLDRDRLLHDSNEQITRIQELEKIKTKLSNDNIRLEANLEASHHALDAKDENIKKSVDLQLAAEKARITTEDNLQTQQKKIQELLELLEKQNQDHDKLQDYIQKLLLEIKNQKEKIILKNEVIRRQEDLIKEVKEKFSTLTHTIHDLEDKNNILSKERDLLSKNLENAMEKLEEQLKTLDENKNIISYLNNCITEHSIGERVIQDPIVTPFAKAFQAPDRFNWMKFDQEISTPYNAQPIQRTTPKTSPYHNISQTYQPISTSIPQPPTTPASYLIQENKVNAAKLDYYEKNNNSASNVYMKGIQNLGLSQILEEELKNHDFDLINPSTSISSFDVDLNNIPYYNMK